MRFFSNKNIIKISGIFVTITIHNINNWFERRQGKKYQDARNDKKLQGIVRKQGAFEKRIFYETNTQVPGWAYGVPRLLVQSRLQRDLAILCVHLNVNIPNLQNICDNCMQTLLVHHWLILPNRGLVIACQTDIHDEIIHLARQAFLIISYAGNP